MLKRIKGSVSTSRPSVIPTTSQTTPPVPPPPPVPSNSPPTSNRAQVNEVRNSLCDRDLVAGWYRFQGAAGDRMAHKCVPEYRCGTEDPGWLNGAHPTVAEGAVTRKVCYHSAGRCCRYSNNIKAKNCSGYYVYKLQKPPNCKARYCGNAGAGKLHS
ncbi:hypothetical protein ACROYT_G008991 [Oculina patagonica]